MFIAMNIFTINNTRMAEFEEVWTNRERHLSEMQGFMNFKLLRGEASEDEKSRDYISHSTWKNSDDFWAWTKSENFKLAHKNKTPEGIIMGPPKFRSFETILDES
ncbi:antibiotic biosynthesis monooxygenase [Bacteriovoracaceae bacterium]|nr:antibiotic biosynthesis monooxygenase [Bacteriovoracaceae bacterium]